MEKIDRIFAEAFNDSMAMMVKNIYHVAKEDPKLGVNMAYALGYLSATGDLRASVSNAIYQDDMDTLFKTVLKEEEPC